MIAVRIVGNADSYRDGLRLLLEREPDLRVATGPCPHAPGACDVAVAELWDCDPATVLDDVRAAAQHAHLVLVLRARDSALAAELRAAGALGLVGDWTPAEQLVLAIREAAAGRSVVDPALEPGEAVEVGGLTELERQLLGYIAAGFTNAEMAVALHRSLRSVEVHRATLVRKLGARRRSDLIRAARTLGLAVAPLAEFV